MSDDKHPERVTLSHPSTSPRKHKTASQQREKPIYHQTAGSREDFTQWEVTVTPLRDTTHVGRALTGGRLKPRATFEVRAAYYGPGLPEFGSQPNTRLIPHTHAEDSELALAIARRVEGLLRKGERDFDFMGLARDIEERREGGG